MPEWYSYGAINFSREQIFPFLLLNLETMKEGNWPPEPIVETGYTDAPIQTGRANHSPFENPVVIAGEIESRLKQTCNNDGLGLVFEVDAGAILYSELAKESQQMLNYISGFNRRDICYPFWKFCHKMFREESLVEPCECGNKRWRTVKKHLSWKCRKCGKVRNSEELKEVLDSMSSP